MLVSLGLKSQRTGYTYSVVGILVIDGVDRIYPTSLNAENFFYFLLDFFCPFSHLTNFVRSQSHIYVSHPFWSCPFFIFNLLLNILNGLPFLVFMKSYALIHMIHCIALNGVLLTQLIAISSLPNALCREPY